MCIRDSARKLLALAMGRRTGLREAQIERERLIKEQKS